VTVQGVLPVAAILFVALAYVSVSWSDEPDFVIRKLVVFTALLIAGYVFAYRFSIFELIKFAVFSCTLTIAMGFGAELAHQSFLPLVSTYRFSGIMHPNAMAADCGIGFLAAIAWSRREPEKKKILIAIAVISMIFLFLTKSRTAFGAAIAGSVMFGAVSASRSKLTTVFLALATFVCFCVAVGSEEMIDPLRDAVLMGRGEEQATGTLSNRLPLWEECLEYIEARPLTGYGYQSFWTPDRTAEISAHQGWVMAHSHNELIEMALGLGVFGSLLYGVVMFGGTAKAIVLARRWNDPDWAFLAALMLFWVLNLMLEVGGLVPAIAPFIALMVLFRVIAPAQPVEAY